MTAHAVLPAGHQGRVDEFFKLALATGIVVVGLEIGYLLFSPLPYDPIGYVVGRDFVNTWIGAKLALSGHPAPYFAIDAYNKLLAQNFGAGYPTHIWSYPPYILLYIWPWGLMPYMAGYVLYCALGLILYIAVVSDGDYRADHLALLAIAPAVTVNIWTGQNGFIITALLVGGLLQLDRRPILAGILFGLLCIKPQLGLLLPLMLALTGRWRTIVAAAMTIVVLIAVTTAIFGTDVWTSYWYNALPTQKKNSFVGFAHFMVHMPTALMNAKIAGLSLMTAVFIQGAVTVATIAAVVWTFWRRRDPALSMAILITAIFTVTPYAFNYDMVLFSWVIILLKDRADNDKWDYALMLGVWATPILTVAFGILHIPVSFPLIFAFGARLFWRLWQDAKEKSPNNLTYSVPQLAAAR
jgi:alpha-1,2-mannosyltransferase